MEQPPGKRRPPWRRIVRWAIVLAFLAALPPVAHRLTAHHNALRIVHDAAIAPPRTVGSPLTLVALNIAHGRGPAGGDWRDDVDRGESDDVRHARYQQIAGLIRSLDADIVVLNEVDFESFWTGHRNYAAYIAEQAGYPWRFEQVNYDSTFWFWRLRHGSAVLSRLPIGSCAPLALPDADRLERMIIGKKRGAVCRIALPDGSTLDLMPVHLEHRSPEARLASAHRIADYVAASHRPFAAIGDFNASASAGGRTAIDRLLSAGFAAAPHGRPIPQTPTFPANHPDRRIDWILVGNGARIVDQAVVPDRVSDHLGLIGTIEIAGPED